MTKKVHYAWIVCFSCIILMYIANGITINGFIVYMPYIMDEYGLTNTQISILTNTRWFATVLCLLFVRQLYQKVDMKKGMFISISCVFLAYLTFFLSRGFAMFILGEFLCGMSYGLGTLVPIPLLLKRWFLKKRQLANSIAITGVGIAILTLPPLITKLIETYGMTKTFLIQLFMVVVLGGIVMILIKNYPEEKGLKPYGYGEVLEEEKNSVIRSKLNKKEWIMLCIASFFINIGGGVGYSCITVHLNHEGYLPMAIATLLSVHGIALTLGRIICGVTADKYGGSFATKVIGGVQVLGLAIFCLAYKGNFATSYLPLIMMGIGFSATALSSAMWSNDLVSNEQYAKAMQVTQIFYTLGCVVFSSIPGLIADKIGGSYIPSFAGFAVCTTISIIDISILYWIRNKK